MVLVVFLNDHGRTDPVARTTAATGNGVDHRIDIAGRVLDTVSRFV